MHLHDGATTTLHGRPRAAASSRPQRRTDGAVRQILLEVPSDVEAGDGADDLLHHALDQGNPSADPLSQ